MPRKPVTTKKIRSRPRQAGSLTDIKGMVGLLKSLYSPAQLREIVNGLGLPAEHAGASNSQEKDK